ncbi:MAG: hypothetical protein Q9191_004450 [Dirinaria sp. TL-2023a]
MAPSLVEPVFSAHLGGTKSKHDLTSTQGLKSSNIQTYEPGRTVIEDHESYEHEHLLPTFPDVKWEPLEEVPYNDRGINGDPEFRNLLAEATDIFDYTPKIGTEILGVNLAKLTAAQKDDLARLIATRGVVFFRDQTDLDIEAQRELGQYFGKLHKHATTSVPQEPGLEDVHVVYTDEKSKDQRAKFAPIFLWHSDVTYELQPLSYTSLKLLTGPPRGGGGDTLWASQYAVYDALSKPMQRYLESLTALHSAEVQATGSRAVGRAVRRDPVTTEHPLVRTNPVTGWKIILRLTDSHRIVGTLSALDARESVRPSIRRAHLRRKSTFLGIDYPKSTKTGPVNQITTTKRQSPTWRESWRGENNGSLIAHAVRLSSSMPQRASALPPKVLEAPHAGPQCKIE